MRPYLLFLFAVPAVAASYYVVPTAMCSNNGDGSSWNCAPSGGAAGAFRGIPPLTRGNVYYLADGAYGSVNFSTGASGSSVIELRKAQTYDHGTDTGWNAGTMGNNQATFSGNPALSFNAPYITINGNGQLTSKGCGGIPSAYNASASAAATPKDCGIRLNTTASSGYVNGSVNVIRASNITFSYVEIVGGGWHNGSNNYENTVTAIYSSSNLTASHVLGRNSGCMYWAVAQTNHLVHDSYFWYINPGDNSCHPEYVMCGNGNSADNMTEYNNVYREIHGQAVWGCVTSGTQSNVKIYNNVFLSPRGLGGGLFWCGNTNSCPNLQFNQNTLIDGTGVEYLVNKEASASVTGTVQNNLVYGTTGTGVGAGTADHNSYINSSSNSCGGTNTCTASGSPNPFVNWQAGNFHLASENALWTSRVALSTPFTVDADGNTFSTDRGAYQYVAGGTPPVITTTSPLITGTVGSAYSATINATGDATITWSIVNAPAWMTGCNGSTGSSCTLSGTPITATTYSNIQITASNARASNSGTFSLTVNAPPAPIVSLDFTSHEFGSVMLGVPSAGFGFNLRNTGNKVLTISSITRSGDFAYTSNCPFSPSTLGIGSSCTITATFTPTQLGARSATILIADDAVDTPQIISLSGTGIPSLAGSIGTGISAGQVNVQ